MQQKILEISLLINLLIHHKYRCIWNNIIKILGNCCQTWTAFFSDQANSSSDPSQILILRFPITRASLRSSPSLSSFTIANWNPSSTQSSSCSSVVSLFRTTSFSQTSIQVLDIPNHKASQANQIYYQAVYIALYLMSQARNPWKSWVFKSRFSFNVRQHGQQQLYFQYKVCWTLYEIIRAPSFSKPYLRIQLPLQSPSKIISSTSVNFHLIFPLLFNKIIFTICFNTPFLYTVAIFHLPIFPCKNIPTIYTKHFFLTSAIYSI